jgi:hypothetical protein
MNNYQMGLDATEAALYSEGSAMRENAEYMKSLEARLERLRATWQQFSLVLGDALLTDLFKGIVATLTAITRGFSEVTESTNGWNILLPALAVGLGIATKAVIALNTSIKGLKLSMGLIGAGIVAIELIASAFIGVSKASAQSTDSLIENAKAAKADADSLESLIEKYNKLKPEAENNTKKQEELAKVMEAIKRIAPQLVTEVDEYGNALSINTKEVDGYISSLRRLSEEQLNLAEVINKTKLQQVRDEIETKKKEVDSLLGDVKEALEKVRDYEDKYGWSSVDDAMQKAKIKLEEIAEEIRIARIKGNQELKEALLEQYKTVMAARDEYAKVKNLVLNSDITIFEELEELGHQEKELEKVEIALENFKNGQDKAKESTDNFAASTSYLNDELGEEEELVTGNKTAIEKLTDKYKESSSIIGELNSLLSDLSEGKSISAEKAAELVMKEHELAKAFEFENGMITVNRDAITELRDKKIKAFADIAEAERKTLTNQQQTLIGKLNNYGIEIQAINSVKDAMLALAGIDKQLEANQKANEMGLDTGVFNQRLRDTRAEVESIHNQLQFIELLKKSISSPDLGTGKGASGSKAKQSAKEIKDYVSDVYQETISSLNLALEKSEHAMSKYIDTSQHFRDELQKQVDLLKQKQDATHDEANRIRELVAETKKQLSTTNDKEKRNELLKLLDDYEQKIINLQSSWLQFQNSIDSKKLSLIESSFSAQSKATEEFRSQLQLSQTRMSSMKDTSAEYANELQIQLMLMERIQESLAREIQLRYAQMQGLSQESQLYQQLQRDAMQLSLAYEQQIASHKQLQQSIRDSIAGVIEQQKNQYIQGIREKNQKLIEELRGLLKEPSLFDFDDFNFDFDQIYQELEELKNKANGITIDIDTSSPTRSIRDLEDELDYLRDIIRDVAYDFEDFQNASTKNRRELEKTIRKESEYIENLRDQIASARSELKQIIALHEQEVRVITEKIKLLQQERQAQIDYYKDQLKVDVTFDQEKFYDELYRLSKGEIDFGTVKIGDSSTDLNDIAKDVLDLNKLIEDLKNGKYADKDSVKDAIEQEIDLINKLRELEKGLTNEIRDREILYEKETSQLEQQVENVNKMYDSQISLLKEKLKLLDEEYQKEDRIQKLRDKDDEIEKTKNDKRFEYITADGKKILTYNKEKVAELEKERDKMLEQFKREDVKKAIQDEIDNLEKAKDKQIKILNNKVAAIKEAYNKERDALNLHLEYSKILQNILQGNLEEHIGNLDDLYCLWQYKNTEFGNLKMHSPGEAPVIKKTLPANL